MLLKLIPAHTEPTIHFSLSFADLPPGLPTPGAWTAQLAQLMLEDLEVPSTLHALDRAVGMTCLLEEVELDIALGEIRCRFIDGKVESWGFWEGITSAGFSQDGGLYGKRLTNALESIVKDVNESTVEDNRAAREREWEKEQAGRRSRSMSVSTATSAGKTSAPTGKVSRHKKQRSFFMQIVSCVGSIINLTGPSSQSSSRFNTSPSSSTITQHQAYSVTYNRPQPVPTTSTRARALRRAARSALVDTFRLFVLTELINRLPGPVVEDDLRRARQNVSPSAKLVPRRDPINFTVWVLHSIRRRALERMERILEEADLEYKSRNPSRMGRTSDDIARGLVATTMEVPLSFSDDEEDITDRTSTVSSSNTVPELDSPMEVDSDSDDGSSLHTPSSSSHTHAWPAAGNKSVSDTSSVTSSNDSLPSPPVPPKDKRSSVIRLAKPQPLAKQHFVSAPVPTPSQTQHLSPAALHEYTDLLDLRTRLGQLLLFAGSQTRVIADEKRTRLQVLAVKSRRRAWSNRALSLMARSQAGLGGQDAYGLATTFRSSPLARYMWTAEDLETMSSSSKSSSPTSTISSRSSVRSTNRPRLRPKIQYDLESMMMSEVNTEPFVGQNRSVEDDDLFNSDMEPAAFTEMKENASSSSLGIGSTQRQPTARKVSISSRAPSEKNGSIIGRLFSVSEEFDGEVQDHYPSEDEEIYHFTSSHKSSSTRHSNSRTFMGCDEIKVHDSEGNTFEGPRETEIQLGFTEFGDRQVPSDIDPDTESGSEVRLTEQARSKPTSRARTASMMGALLQRAKSSLQSNKEKEVRQELSKNSLLCQPVPSSVLNQSPAPAPIPAPKLQMQSQLRLKRSASPSGDAQVQKSVKIPRPIPAIYEDAEVDMELDLQFRVGEYRQSESIEFIGIQDVSPGMAVDPENEKIEFTLSMDLPKTTRRRRERANFEYPTKPLARHEFEDNLRPMLETIFVQPETVPQSLDSF